MTRLQAFVAPLSLALEALASGQVTSRISVDSNGGQGDNLSALSSLSIDGRFIAFASAASNLVSNDTNGCGDIFVYDRFSLQIERVSVDSSGNEGNGDCSTFFGGPSISADGRFVAFHSFASNLVPNDMNARSDVFVFDRTLRIIERVSVDSSGIEGDQDSEAPSISGDGNLVAFDTWASNLSPGDINSVRDVYVRDRNAGITECVSVKPNGNQGNGDSFHAVLTADGRHIAFCSGSTNLVSNDTNGVLDVFVRDRLLKSTERVSVDSAGQEGNNHSSDPAISSDGQVVAFDSLASNLAAGDGNGAADIFVRDRITSKTERISVDSSGAEGNAYSNTPSLSADGQIVAFCGAASNLVASDTNGTDDGFVRNRALGTTERVSIDSMGVEGNGYSSLAMLSPDGSFVSFGSFSSNLVSGDSNGYYDVFLRDLRVAATWFNYGQGFPGTLGVPSITAQQNPVIGTSLTLSISNSLGSPTVGLTFVGFQQADIPTRFGGHVFVLPVITLPMSFSFGSNTLLGAIPLDNELCGLSINLQAVEADAGAANGVSFTEGIELVLGR